jgi:hypothetical protein
MSEPPIISVYIPFSAGIGTMSLRELSHEFHTVKHLNTQGHTPFGKHSCFRLSIYADEVQIVLFYTIYKKVGYAL